MKTIKYNCKKCGSILEIPEKTESVLCGNCATWNRPRSIFSGFGQSDDSTDAEGSILQRVPGKIFSEIPDAITGTEKIPQPVETGEKPAKPGFFSLVTLLFIIAPFVSFFAAKLKLPPSATFLIIAAIIIAISLIKKRS